MDDSGSQHIFHIPEVKSDGHESPSWRDIIGLAGDECTSVGQIAGSSSDLFISPLYGAQDNNPPTFELPSLLPLHWFTMIY